MVGNRKKAVALSVQAAGGRKKASYSTCKHVLLIYFDSIEPELTKNETSVFDLGRSNGCQWPYITDFGNDVLLTDLSAVICLFR